jgi:hypothetical protein
VDTAQPLFFTRAAGLPRAATKLPPFLTMPGPSEETARALRELAERNEHERMQGLLFRAVVWLAVLVLADEAARLL